MTMEIIANKLRLTWFDFNGFLLRSPRRIIHTFAIYYYNLPAGFNFLYSYIPLSNAYGLVPVYFPRFYGRIGPHTQPLKATVRLRSACV